MEKILNEIDSQIKLGNINIALDSLQSLVTKYKKNPEILKEISLKFYITGQEIMKKGDYRNAIGLWKFLSLLFPPSGLQDKICDIKNALSFCFRVLRKTNEAIKEILSAIEAATMQTSTNYKLAALHLNACAIYREDLKDSKSAMIHAELAYFHAKESITLAHVDISAARHTLGVTYYNYGLLKEENNEMSTALLWYREGFKFCEEFVNDLFLEQAFREKINFLEGKSRLSPIKLINRGSASVVTSRAKRKKSPYLYDVASIIDRSKISSRALQSRKSSSYGPRYRHLDPGMSRYVIPPHFAVNRSAAQSEYSNNSSIHQHSQYSQPDSMSTIERSTEVSARTSKYKISKPATKIKIPKKIKVQRIVSKLENKISPKNNSEAVRSNIGESKIFSDEFYRHQKAIVKIQSWFRSLKCQEIYGKQRKFYDYIAFGKAILNEGYYFVTVYRSIKQAQLKHRFMRKKVEINVVVDAFPLEKGFQKPSDLDISLSDICLRLSIESDEFELRKIQDSIIDKVTIRDGHVDISNEEKTTEKIISRIIYIGKAALSDDAEYDLEMKYVFGKEKKIEIIAVNGDLIYNYTMQLDLLQDYETIKKKVPFILSRLLIENGSLQLKI
ncbi:unnamed protein product [Blepharisma stoltei]|uniref:Uncharacterized protein n=1 Tax=Blepharisma stoltei TaxID=1481888 RepID=A0AAU9IB88_9CILI|nr:unnamed protein product [Blepharisma stoltei]